MAKSDLKLVTPTTVNRTVAPGDAQTGICAPANT